MRLELFAFEGSGSHSDSNELPSSMFPQYEYSNNIHILEQKNN